jgi:hypothetical protein
MQGIFGLKFVLKVQLVTLEWLAPGEIQVQQVAVVSLA